MGSPKTDSGNGMTTGGTDLVRTGRFMGYFNGKSPAFDPFRATVVTSTPHSEMDLPKKTQGG